MALSTCFVYPHIFPKFELHGSTHVYNHHEVGSYPKLTLSLQHLGTKCFGQVVPKLATELNYGRRFLGGCRITLRPKVDKFTFSRKTCGVCCSWLTNSEIASGVFTLGTAAVLPLYTLMVVAPRSELTKKTMQSSIPFTVLGLMYAYLLYLSWTPETIRFMFASKYWLPELPGIAKMFSSEMTLSSAWIHLLVVDLFAARHVYEDGLENEIETRHSVSMCLLFCPIGIVSHLITKSLSKGTEETIHR